ncbi:hypothetical protein I0D00_06945 [Pseudomonas lalucatii]|uniref:Uncharacterized protein n=1 Tax=Pseudomonas lalucatii TaxID=1424203 RepID=A0ABS5PYX8_9PSED|nr:hypothetical protein [Pseudomonas lalucatii]MBS7661682.1 hypothetical protein [Pseudomonas lalucatii]MBS7691971.1 hypothetical protein [Pseudomonas lalucatii]MBS7723909.1 hypothetical protein [Pseudomonas lalucatii]
MDTKSRQVTELLSLSARSMTHLTAALAQLSFELMRSGDPSSQRAGQRMIDHLAQISGEIDQQWAMIGALTGQPVPEEKTDLVIEVQMQAAPGDDWSSGGGG